jgi:tetratricopeptide (TPR) repeat protein
LAGARGFYGRALPLYEAIGERLGQANTLLALGDLAVREADLAGARGFYGRALPIFEGIGDRLGQANTLKALGDLALREDDLAAARGFYGRTLPIYEAIGDSVGLMNTYVNMGRMYRYSGDIEQSKIHFQKWLAIVNTIPAYKDHPVTRNIMREYQALTGEPAPQPSLDDALRQLKPVYDQIGADALREALVGQGLPAEVVEDILARLAAMPSEGAPAPEPQAPNTLPENTVKGLAGNTVAVMTSVREKRNEWRGILVNQRAQWVEKGADYTIEVVFADALLAILDGQPPVIASDNPYAGVVGQVVKFIEDYRPD